MYSTLCPPTRASNSTVARSQHKAMPTNRSVVKTFWLRFEIYVVARRRVQPRIDVIHFFPSLILKCSRLHTEAVRELHLRLVTLSCGLVEANGIFWQRARERRADVSAPFPGPQRSRAEGGRRGRTCQLGRPCSVRKSRNRLGRAARCWRRRCEWRGRKLALSGIRLARTAARKVEEFLASFGMASGNVWCASFVYWCVIHVAEQVGRSNCLPRTGA